MNSTWDTRNLGSGHCAENLDSIFLGGEKKGKMKSARKFSIRTEAAKGHLRRLRLPWFNPRNYAPCSHLPHSIRSGTGRKIGEKRQGP